MQKYCFIIKTNIVEIVVSILPETVDLVPYIYKWHACLQGSQNGANFTRYTM